MFWYIFIKFRGKKQQMVVLKRASFQTGNIRCENTTQFSCKNFIILVNN